MLSHTFSNPSKHKYAPPAISSGVIAHGAKALSASAAGVRNSSLFFSEPTAIFAMIGISRLAAKPTT